MRPIIWTALPLLLLAPASAQDVVQASVGEVGEEDAHLSAFVKLETELKARRDELSAAIKSAGKISERSKLRKERKALPGVFFQRFDALANGGNPHALLWLIKNAKYSGTPKAELAAYQRGLYEWAIRDHVASQEFEVFLDALMNERKALGESEIETLAMRAFESTTDPDQRAGLLYRLGEMLGTSRDEEARKRGIAAYERVAAEYPDSPWADRVTGHLFELKRLQVGMVAPEIEGEDLDGVAFKLSDYRGKVVMLDFWGDW